MTYAHHDICWSVLGLREDGLGVTKRDVCAAYRKLALQLHPDKAAEDESAAFIRLHAAYTEALRRIDCPADCPADCPDDRNDRHDHHSAAAPTRVQDRWVAKACRVLIDVGRCAAVALSTLNVPDIHVRIPVRGGSRARVRRFVVDVARRDPSTCEMSITQQTLCLTVVTQHLREGVHRFAGAGNESAFIPGHCGDVVLHVVEDM